TYGPCARLMKRGVPPTERKARTGELTPPGMLRQARSKSSALLDMVLRLGVGVKERRRAGQRGRLDVGRLEQARNDGDAVGPGLDRLRGVAWGDAADCHHGGAGRRAARRQRARLAK